MYSVNKRLDLTTRSRDHLFLGEEDDSRTLDRHSYLWTLQRQQQQHWPRNEHKVEEDQRRFCNKTRDSIFGRSYLSHQDESSSCTTDEVEGRVQWQKGGWQDEEHSGRLGKAGKTPAVSSGSSSSSDVAGGGLHLVRTKTLRVIS